jgi:hypothetical protein
MGTVLRIGVKGGLSTADQRDQAYWWLVKEFGKDQADGATPQELEEWVAYLQLTHTIEDADYPKCACGENVVAFFDNKGVCRSCWIAAQRRTKICPVKP